MTVTLVPETGGERPSQQIARRVRGLLGENQISGRRMAAALHMDQKAFSRRYRGEVAWSTDELADLARVLRVSFGELCAIRDSNPEPADSEPRRVPLRLVGGPTISPRRVPAPVIAETQPRRHLVLVEDGAA